GRLIGTVDASSADAAVHDRFLRPLGSHADVMMMVFNHLDEIPPDQVKPAVDDVRRLLTLDGLGDVPLFATSATRGDGMGELRAALVERVAAKKYAKERLTADIKASAAKIAEQTGTAKPGDLHEVARGELLDACADAAGVPLVIDAIHSASLLRARQATGWPITTWLSRFKPDPLRRLHLDGLGARGDAGPPGRHRVGRTSIPEPTQVQRARVDGAVRSVADSVTDGMAKPWATSVRAASVSRLDDFADALDKAVGSADLGIRRDPRWWNVLRVLQWLLFLTALSGALWLAALAFFSYLQLPDPRRIDWHGFPVPTLMLLGGVVLGVLLAAGCRYAARRSARRRADRADARLRSAIESVADEFVVDPMRNEVDAYSRCRDGIKVALKR
ncbi:MAG: ABC transporter, partial [Nocardioidaceae bacterium]